jgi:DNA-directed RNA polymerase subunit RPC12/RpoP
VADAFTHTLDLEACRACGGTGKENNVKTYYECAACGWECDGWGLVVELDPTGRFVAGCPSCAARRARVPRGHSCPICGEDGKDRLEWDQEGQALSCTSCHSHYTPAPDVTDFFATDRDNDYPRGARS